MSARLVLGEDHVEQERPVEDVVANMTDILQLDECMFFNWTLLMPCRDSQKAVEQGWGHEATSWESAAPIAEADREAEKKEAGEATSAPEAEDSAAKEAEKEPEEEQIQTYADYLANQMKTGFSIGEVRKADQSKWEATTSILNKKVRQVEEALFGEKTNDKTPKSTSTKKTAPKKVVLDIEQRFTPAPRGGRGEGRGGRGGRGASSESRGAGRGRGDGTSRGRGRGEDRGSRGRGGASGSTRGGRGGAQTIDVADTNAFPALG
jgi:plasminogen activator inhibitor 1 RNA-binding protein